MSEAAIGNKQLAIGENPASEFANCLSAITYREDAISCTVTARVTSVTHRGLAGSVLIRVREVYSAQGPKVFGTAKYEGLALVDWCFCEATCIQ